MTNKSDQLNLGILGPQLPNIFELCAKIDEKTRLLVAHPNQWPNLILCLKMNWGDGREGIFSEFAKNGGKVFIIDDRIFDETALFFEFTKAEAGHQPLLILTKYAKGELEIKSADLKSRFDNVTFIENMPANKANLAIVFDIALKKAGLAIAPKFQTRIINELNLDFVIISQLIGYIMEKFPIGIRPNNENIGELILGFEREIQNNRLI